jgi:hypothetical protein
MQFRNSINYSGLAQNINPLNQNSESLLSIINGAFVHGGINRMDSHAATVSTVFGIVSKMASLQAINDTMMVLTFISLVAILPAIFMRIKKKAKTEEKKANIEVDAG